MPNAIGFSHTGMLVVDELIYDEKVLEHLLQVRDAVVQGESMQLFIFFYEVVHSTKQNVRVVGEVMDQDDMIVVVINYEMLGEGN